MYKNKSSWIWGRAGISILLLSSASAYADITGKVFNDTNGNGQQDSVGSFAEPGVGNIKVTCTDSAGSTATTLTDNTGAYTLKGCSGASRVEFTGLALGEYPSPVGAGNHSSTQFVVEPASEANFGIYIPDAYVASANPKMFVPRYVNGSMKAGVTSGDTDLLMGFNYLDSGIPGGGGPTPTGIAKGSQIGSVWSVAYSRQSGKLFAAAFLKRYVGLGPAGTGGLYMMDANATSPTNAPVTVSLDALGYPTQAAGAYTATPVGFNGVVGSNAERGLPDGGSTPSADPSAYGQVGKVGLGGTDLSTDGRYLFTTNLYDRKIYRLDLKDPYTPVLDSSTPVKQYTDVPWLNLNCDSGVARPFALKYYAGNLYAGAVCTGENKIYPGGLARYADGLRAYVWKIDPNSTGAGELQIEFPLNYTKETAGAGDNTINSGWYTWSDNWEDALNPGYLGSAGVPGLPQPILSDIEFDAEGSMILALMDRAGHQWGLKNFNPLGAKDDNSWLSYSNVIGGDILRTYRDPATGKFSLEANGVAGPYTATSAAPQTRAGYYVGSGPGTPNGEGAAFTAYTGIGKEFYYGDGANLFGNNYPNPHHNEGIMGGLAIFPLSGEVEATGMDAVDNHAWSGGTYRLNNNTGERPAGSGYNLYSDQGPGNAAGFFGKANGLGDVEILSDLPPIEVGNRVWKDGNGNGIQDAGEAGIDGVAVKLVCGTDNATATTANGGQYYFSNATGSNATFLKAGASCTLSVDSTQAALKDYSLSKQDADSITDNSPTTDLRDSDAKDNAGKAEITFTVGNAGENNHTLDIGYQPQPPKSDLSIIKAVDKANPKHGDTVVYTLTVTNQGPDAATAVNVTDVLPAGITYVSDDGAGAYDKATGIWAVGALAKDDKKILSITATVN